MDILTAPLAKALIKLERNLAFARAYEGTDVQRFEAARDGAIQAFEYSYHAAIGAIGRAAEDRVKAGDYDAAGFPGKMRIAWEAGIIPASEPWVAFRDMRNKTSHSYLEEVAAAVYAGIPAFLEEAKTLLTKLDAIHGSPA